jgi:hypothetical protein
MPSVYGDIGEEEEPHEEGMGMGHYHGDRDEDELPDELPGDEGPEDAGLEVSDEGGDDLDLSPEEKEGLAADIVRAVAQELESALSLEEPIEVAVEDEPGMDLGGEEELDMELPGEELPGDEEPGEEELALQEGEAKAGKFNRTDIANKASGRWLKEEEDETLEESEEEVTEATDEEDLVNEVLRRVLARLSKK